jgi:hypothetical protein
MNVNSESFSPKKQHFMPIKVDNGESLCYNTVTMKEERFQVLGGMRKDIKQPKLPSPTRRKRYRETISQLAR